MRNETLPGGLLNPGDALQTALPYRFAPHPPGVLTVPRNDLVRDLTDASSFKRLVVVRGPAGSGKTTLLSQWAVVCHDMKRRVAWLTVDQADRDPARFVAGLSEALEHAGCAPVAAAFRDVAADAPLQSHIEIAQSLASVCNRSEEQLVFVLDQYEDLDGPLAGEILSGFLEHVVTTRLIIASRVRPAIPVGRLRARDQFFEIGPSELNLTPFETRSLFEADVPEIYSRRLHYDTSGEAVAVGFARRVMDELPGVSSAPSWQDQLHEYYRAEVLETLPPQLRTAMSRLVVVERFDLSLASALIGRNAAEIIERLHHVEGILLRQRGSQEFYFAEMLRRFLELRLAGLEEAEHVELHRRAASWFAERGRLSEAFRHAVAAGARGHALMLLEQIGYTNLVAQQGAAAAHQLLSAIGIAAETADAGTLLSLAVIHAHQGHIEQAVARWGEAQRALATQESSGSQALHDQLVLAQALIAGITDETLQAQTAPALERHLARLPADDHENRAFALIFLSWDRFCRGDVAGAQSLADASAAEYAETEALYGCLFVHVHRVLARFWGNDLESALEEISLAEQMTRIFMPDDSRLRAMTGMLRAVLLFELGRPDPLVDLTSLVGAVGALEGWIEIQIWAHVQGARAALTQSRDSEARGIISYGREVARRLGSRRLSWNMDLAAVDLSVRLGELERAAREAAALSLTDGSFLDDAALNTCLTWQERIGGMFVAIRLAEAERAWDRAERLLAAVRILIADTSAVRFVAELELAQARLSRRSGDREGGNQHIQVARRLCGATVPTWLFLDFAEGQYDGADTQPAAPVEMPAVTMGDPLTPRERQILLFMGEGHPNKVAAYRLGLSEATVKFHLRNIYRKLQAQNRTQALARYRTLTGPS